MADIESQVKQILRESLDVTDDQLMPNADLFQDLGADSLDATQITMELEETFGIEIPDDDVQKIRTVQQLIDYVRSRVSVEAKEAVVLQVERS